MLYQLTGTEHPYEEGRGDSTASSEREDAVRSGHEQKKRTMVIRPGDADLYVFPFRSFSPFEFRLLGPIAPFFLLQPMQFLDPLSSKQFNHVKRAGFLDAARFRRLALALTRFPRGSLAGGDCGCCCGRRGRGSWRL